MQPEMSRAQQFVRPWIPHPLTYQGLENLSKATTVTLYIKQQLSKTLDLLSGMR